MAKPNRTRKSNSKNTRRTILKGTAGGAASLAVMSSIQFATGQVKGSNDRIGVGFIGAGGRAGAHLSMVRNLRERQKMPVEHVAVCDCYRPRMERAKAAYKMPAAYMDYRELIADKKVDIVAIATPDHHHGYAAIAALAAGKHVYCEKPVTHWRQWELTRKLADVAAKSDAVFQLGTQAMSDGAWHLMKKLVQEEGIIGQPLFGETGFFRTGDWGERGMHVDDKNAKPGKDMDWDAFLGDAPKVPYSVDRQFRWRLFEDYAGGPATDLYPHCLTQVVDILGVGMPDTVVGTGGIHRYDYKLREVPDTFSLLANYPEKVTISVVGTQGNDFVGTDRRGSGARCPFLRGWDGTLSLYQNKEIVFTPLRVRGAKKPQRFPIPYGEDNVKHWMNLVECARTRNKKTWSPMQLAYRVQTILQMAMLGWKHGKVAKFDEKKRSIVL